MFGQLLQCVCILFGISGTKEKFIFWHLLALKNLQLFWNFWPKIRDVMRDVTGKNS